MRTAFILLAALQIFATSGAQAATSRITCLDRSTFNYGVLGILDTGSAVEITIQSTALGDAGLRLIGEEAGSTQSLTMIIPRADCVISNAGTRLASRCYSHAKAQIVKIMGDDGVKREVELNYFSVDTLVRQDESVEGSLPRRVVHSMTLMTGEDEKIKRLYEDTNFQFNECSRVDTP